MASWRVFTPTWAPSGATTLSWGARISSLMRRSAIQASFVLRRSGRCLPDNRQERGTDCGPRRPPVRGNGPFLSTRRAGRPCYLGALGGRGGRIPPQPKAPVAGWKATGFRFISAVGPQYIPPAASRDRAKPPPPDLSLTWSSGQPSRREPIRQTRRPEPPVEPSRAYMPGPKRCPNPPSNRMLKMASSRPIVYPLLPAILTLSSSKNAKSAASTRLRRAPSPAATASRYRNQVVRGLGLVQRPGRAISFGL